MQRNLDYVSLTLYDTSCQEVPSLYPGLSTLYIRSLPGSFAPFPTRPLGSSLLSLEMQELSVHKMEEMSHHTRTDWEKVTKSMHPPVVCYFRDSTEPHMHHIACNGPKVVLVDAILRSRCTLQRA